MMKAKFSKSKSSNPKKSKKKYQKQKCYSKNDERVRKRKNFWMEITCVFYVTLVKTKKFFEKKILILRWWDLYKIQYINE